MHGKAQSRRRIEDTGSIHVDADSTLVRGVAYLAHCAHGVHRSARHIMGLLDRHRPGGRAIRRHRAEISNDLADGEQSPFRLDGADHAAAEPGHHREFVIEQVGARIANYLLPMLGEQLDGDCVPHRAGGNEQGGRLAGDFGGTLFEAVDGGIFAIHVVADFGFEHGAPHGRRGLGNGIAAQIDHRIQELLEDFIGVGRRLVREYSIITRGYQSGWRRIFAEFQRISCQLNKMFIFYKLRTFFGVWRRILRTFFARCVGDGLGHEARPTLVIADENQVSGC